MSAARKQLSFIIIGVLAAFLMAAFCRPLAADCLSVLANGWGEQRYDAAAASGDAIALVSRADETFRLTTSTLDGDRTAVRTVTLPVSAAECTVAGIYPAADGSVLLGLYEPADSAAENLTLYRIPAEGEPERLLLYPCTGDTADERMANTFFSTFTEQEGEILFALVDDGTAQAYTYGGAGSGLAQGGTASAYGAVSAAVLSDGTIALGGQGWLELDGASVDFSLDNSIVTQLTQVGAGLFYIDSASLKVFYSDLIGQDAVEVLDLSRSGQMDGLTSLSLTRDGSALLLRDGHTLELVTANGTQQLGGLLYRSGAACVAILVGLVQLWAGADRTGLVPAVRQKAQLSAAGDPLGRHPCGMRAGDRHSGRQLYRAPDGAQHGCTGSAERAGKRGCNGRRRHGYTGWTRCPNGSRGAVLLVRGGLCSGVCRGL